MKIDNAVSLLRSLKGAPLSVLIAIRLFPGPASLLQLAAVTGYERTAVTQAVTCLEMMGFVERAHYRGWQLSSLAMQLPLWTPSEIGTIAPDAPALGAGSQVDRPPPGAGMGELKAVKNHFQGEASETAGAGEILKAGKNHFRQNGYDTGDAPEILKAVKNHSQGEGSETAGACEILKAGKNHFQQNGSETGDASGILKAGKNHFQQNGCDTGDAPAILKAGKNHFQQDDLECLEDPEILKVVKNYFQTLDHVAESLKAGKNHFQPGDNGCSGSGGGSSSLINLTPEVKEPPPLQPPQEGLKAGKNHFQPTEQENAPPPFDDAEQALLQDLIDLTGCPRKRAEKAVRTALDEGYFTPWLHLQVLYWHTYIHDDRGSNLKNPGYFVAKKLENGEACPFEKARSCHWQQSEDLRYALRKLQNETTN